MRLARIDADKADASAELAALASAGQLDLLQLDYATADPRGYSARFFEHFQTLHKHLYLEPGLRVVTNAGGAAVTACVEALGGYLRDHGDRRTLICAVRGANLLSRLAELTTDGIDLLDEATNKPLRDLKLPLLAAQVELGAGPFATAWEEDARIVVAGCYDAAAPFLGVTAAEFAIDWNNYDELAPLAIAAHCRAVAELDEYAGITLEARGSQPVTAEDLQSLPWERGLLRHADVHCKASELALAPAEFGKVTLAGISGRAPEETWRVRLTYDAEIVVDSCSQTIVRWSRVPRDAVRVSVDTRPAAEWF